MRKGQKAEIIGHDRTREVTVNEMQMFKKTVPQAQAGDHVGVLVRGVKTDEVCAAFSIAWLCYITRIFGLIPVLRCDEANGW